MRRTVTGALPAIWLAQANASSSAFPFGTTLLKEADALGLQRIDGLRSEQQIQRVRPRNGTRQHDGGEMRAHTPLGLGKAENGVLLSNADVAGQRQLEPPGNGRAVDGSNDRLVGLVDHLEQTNRCLADMR